MSIMKTSINATNYNNRLISSLQLHHHIKQFVVLHNQSFSFNPLSSKQSGSSSFLENRSLRYLNNGDRGQNNNRSNRDFAIYSSDHQGDLVSLGTFMESWKGWIIGALVTVILPFLTNKWGPLLKWTKELEAAEERVEEIAEAIEQVAVDVEKAAEDFAEKLPEGGQLKGAMTFVENAAKQVIKDADLVEELMDKVEEAEKKLEDMIEDAEAKAKSKEVAEVANETK